MAGEPFPLSFSSSSCDHLFSSVVGPMSCISHYIITSFFFFFFRPFFFPDILFCICLRNIGDVAAAALCLNFSTLWESNLFYAKICIGRENWIV